MAFIGMRGFDCIWEGTQGTANWMAPEVILNEKPGRGADIWSLGATTIEMLTGNAPYAGLPQMSVMYKIAQGELPQMPEKCSERARGFIMECLQRQASLRPKARKLLAHSWLRSYALDARTKVLRLVTEEIEGLSDSIVTSPTFNLESALRGPMHTRSSRRLDEQRSRCPPLLNMTLQKPDGAAREREGDAGRGKHVPASPSSISMKMLLPPPALAKAPEGPLLTGSARYPKPPETSGWFSVAH